MTAHCSRSGRFNIPRNNQKYGGLFYLTALYELNAASLQYDPFLRHTGYIADKICKCARADFKILKTLGLVRAYVWVRNTIS